DVRGGRVCVRGWQERLPLSPEDLTRRWVDAGARWLIFTDVERDGMEAGLNVEAAAALARQTGMRVIASGGVAGPEDVRRARRAGLSGVIVGRALYEGRVSLRELLENAGEDP
ncbi:MAG: HisA/HisF-related TIM barrel protein, partial [Anaerolineae bacterium]